MVFQDSSFNELLYSGFAFKFVTLTYLKNQYFVLKIAKTNKEAKIKSRIYHNSTDIACDSGIKFGIPR